MQFPSRMLTRLQTETRALHPEADAPWVELMTTETTRERYIATLISTYGFEAPTEAALSMTPGVNTFLQLRPRARSGFIVQDLLVLGFSPARIARLPQCCQIVPFRDVGEALGWLYVVERTTLLHDTVKRHLQLRLPNIYALSYLDAYDGVVTDRWKELGEALDYVMLTMNAHDQIIAGARAAFATLHQWVEGEQTEQFAQV